MSIGTPEFEEWAVAEVETLALAVELYVQGKASRVELASAVGRARGFLVDEALFQDRENQVGGFPVEYFTRGAQR